MPYIELDFFSVWEGKCQKRILFAEGLPLSAR
jgi:hypothetical protein